MAFSFPNVTFLLVGTHNLSILSCFSSFEYPEMREGTFVYPTAANTGSAFSLCLPPRERPHFLGLGGHLRAEDFHFYLYGSDSLPELYFQLNGCLTHLNFTFPNTKITGRMPSPQPRTVADEEEATLG